MEHLSEQFGARLVRVIKNVKRRTSDGGTKTVKQSFHVRQANPGDQYAGSKQRAVGPLGEKPRKPSKNLQLKMPGSDAPEADVAAPEGQAATQDQGANEIPRRISVRYHEVMWKQGEPQEKKRDPIPTSVRDRFDPKNREAMVPKPLTFDSPVHGVAPTDAVLWGVHEPEYLDKMRGGRIVRLGLVGEGSGIMFAKIEAQDGTALHAYMGLESLVDPHVYSMWDDLYDLQRGEGGVPKRCAASYEVAKACGFDDLVPPTVVRQDRYGDIDPILPADLLERREQYTEMLARRTGEHPDSIRKQLSGFAWIQVLRGDSWTIEKEDWFEDIFQREGEVDRRDALNHIFGAMPPERRMGFLRTAVFDFVLWTGDRHLGDIVFCPNERHPMHLVWNGLSCPCPRKIGLRVLEQGGEMAFVSGEVNLKGGVPMMWSEPLIMVATRGDDAELDDFEKIAHYVSHRMKSDRPFELVRSLLEHEIAPLAIAGVMSRIWLLATHSKDIARNPYFVAQYYADLVAGNPREEMQNLALFVNQAMKRVVIRDFDFFSEMQDSENDADPEMEDGGKTAPGAEDAQ